MTCLLHNCSFFWFIISRRIQIVFFCVFLRFSHTKPSSASSSSNNQSRQTTQPPVRQISQPLAAMNVVQPRVRQVTQQPHSVPPPTRSVEIVSPNFQSLAPSSSNRVHTSSFSSDTSWADAPEFVPRFLDGKKT